MKVNCYNYDAVEAYLEKNWIKNILNPTSIAGIIAPVIRFSIDYVWHYIYLGGDNNLLYIGDRCFYFQELEIETTSKGKRIIFVENNKFGYFINYSKETANV